LADLRIQVLAEGIGMADEALTLYGMGITLRRCRTWLCRRWASVAARST
jgi:hypothetical protein